MAKILITGGLGFVGSYLTELCIDKGHDVTILSRSDSKKSNISHLKNVKLIIKDVKDINHKVKSFDLIFHLAGSTDNYAIIENQPYRDIELNCTNTIALLEACKKHNPKVRILFASTFFVNGNIPLPATPKSPCKPLGLYGATRLAGEHFCHIYNKIFDMNINIVRFTNVYGPREKISKKKAGFNFLIKQAVDGKELQVYNDGDFYRDYIYVTDAAEACLLVAQKGKADMIYYIGNGEYVKFKELIDIIIEKTNAKTKSIEPPDFHKRVGIIDFVCDNSDLKKLGWSPKISLKDGISKTIEYYNE